MMAVKKFLSLALLVAALAPAATQGQATTDEITSVKKPLEPLENLAQAGVTVPMSSSTPSEGLAALDKKAFDPLRMRGGGATAAVGLQEPAGKAASSFEKISSESHTSTTSGPNQQSRSTSSHSVRVEASSSEDGHQLHTFESAAGHDDAASNGAIAAIATATSSAGAGANSAASWARDDEHLELPTIIDNSASGLRSQWHGHHEDVDSDDDDDHEDDHDDDDDDDDLHHRHRHSLHQFDLPQRHHHQHQHESTYVPSMARSTSSRPIEHVDETYIDTSDPSDPKKVHYSKDVRAKVGPDGESYQHQESKTANSLGANPNSHSYSHSSSSSSYVASHSGHGGGNYRHYGGETHVKPYHQINLNRHHQHQHHQDSNNILPALPPLPALPGMEPLFHVPYKGHNAAPAWLDLAGPSVGGGYGSASHQTFPSYQRGSYVSGHGVDDVHARRSHLRQLKRNGKALKRQLNKLRHERLERGQYSELEDFL